MKAETVKDVIVDWCNVFDDDHPNQEVSEDCNPLRIEIVTKTGQKHILNSYEFNEVTFACGTLMFCHRPTGPNRAFWIDPEDIESIELLEIARKWKDNEV